MPPIYTEKSIHVGIHEFKTNIAKYIRILNEGNHDHIIITSRGKGIGAFVTFAGMDAREAKKAQKEMQESLSGLLNGSGADLSGLLNGSNEDLTGLLKRLSGPVEKA